MQLLLFADGAQVSVAARLVDVDMVRHPTPSQTGTNEHPARAVASGHPRASSNGDGRTERGTVGEIPASAC
jgi:hypothetical protein